jgi:mannan endo-1,4-beta-mannosidase
MLNKIVASLFLPFLVVFSSQAQDPNFHIYLCFGQSNMEGSAPIQEMDLVVNPRFKVLQSLDCGEQLPKDTWRTAVPPLAHCNTGLSPADYFGRTMVDNLPDSITVGVINVSVGGSDIRLFDKDQFQDFDDTFQEDWFQDKIKAYDGNPYRHLLELAQKAKTVGVIKGILLHQGETNTGDKKWPSYVAKVYQDLLIDLSLDAENVPLLAGEVVHADQGGVCAEMNKVINKLPKSIESAYVISSQGVPALYDSLHFSSDGYRQLGVRYAKKMLELQQVDPVVVESNQASRISSTHQLLSLLKRAKGKGILFGHQDTYAYGYTWKNVEGNSDVKRVSGDYPAMFGWELGAIELGGIQNLDSILFDDIKRYIQKAHFQGGINTISWHPYSVLDRTNSWNTKKAVVRHIIPGGKYHTYFKRDLDLLADFLNELKTPEGVEIPFIFRPWHEMDGTWFWWGSSVTSPEELQELFRFTIDYLRKEKGVNHMLVAYSPDRNPNSPEEYLKWYPGDDYIDIIGMDNYHDLSQNGSVDDAIQKLHFVIDLANEKGKITALTESGEYNLPDESWYLSKLGKVLSDPKVAANISYAHVWHNDPTKHYFFARPEHPTAEPTREFLSQPGIWLLNDLVNFVNSNLLPE